MSGAVVYVVVCGNYDDKWICGCFVDDEEGARELQGRLDVEAEHHRCPGNDPRYFIEAWEDGVERKLKEAIDGKQDDPNDPVPRGPKYRF